jgi:tRNA (uracil-5-)-methyltransferase
MSEEGSKKNMRIRLLNIPSMYGVTQVRKWVAKYLDIPVDALVCRKAPKWSHAILSFRSHGTFTRPEDVEVYRSRLAGAQWKQAKLDAKVEEALEVPILRKEMAEPATIKCIKDQVTPLWNVPYEEQLKRKQDKIRALLKEKVAADISCLEPIKASPMIKGYRNKCEFTIAHNEEGTPTVGFLLGGYREGIVTVANAKDVSHTPEVMKRLADHLQELTKSTADQLPVYDRTSKKGFWRMMLVRVHDDDIMAVVQVQTAGMPEESTRNAAIEQLVEHMRAFRYGEKNNEITSFYIQDTSAVFNGIDPKTPFQLKFGSENVTQTLCGLKFQISPQSFFQANISATEILYSTIAEYVRDSLSPQTVLLDLCCGTGTIGLTLAGQVERVVGVELVAEAIADAKKNAQLNNIDNVSFECERVEKVIEKVIASIPEGQSIVVVLDPPRSGVHNSVIKAIRRCPRICRVVYVACNPEAAAGNFIDLTRSTTNGMPGIPFNLRRGVAVDLFPMTEHCELVLQFHR